MSSPTQSEATRRRQRPANHSPAPLPAARFERRRPALAAALELENLLELLSQVVVGEDELELRWGWCRAAGAAVEKQAEGQEQLWVEAARLVEAEELLLKVNSELAELEQSQDQEAEAFQSLAVIDVDEESECGAIDVVDLVSDSD